MADRSVVVRLRADISDYKRGMADAAAKTDLLASRLDRTGVSVTRTEKDIDRLSGRIRLFAEATATIGPSLIPLGAAAIPALTGLTAGLGAAAGAAGVTALAFSGVGDSLKALDTYQLDPTTENLAAMREEFAKLGPAGAQFVRHLDSLEPELRSLQLTARDGLFPGVEDGLDDLMTRLPQVRQIISNIATELGGLAGDAGKGLKSDRFTAFFDYLESDAAPMLAAFGHSIGNVVEGLGSLLVAFAPLSRDFASGLEDATRAFADWSAGVSQTEDFRDFVDYIRESGPAAADLLAAVSRALVGIVEAAAPFGQTVLPVLTTLADALAAISQSPVGPPLFTAAAGFIALNRATKILGPGLGSMSDAFLDLRTSPNLAATAVERFGRAAKIASGAAGMGLLVTSLSETDRALAGFEGAAGGALAGFAVGGPWGAAVGGAIGLVVSLGHAHDQTAAEVDELTATFDRQTGAITQNTRAAAVQKLQQNGLLEAAQQLGVSTSLVTDAVLGNARAQGLLNATLAGYDVDHSISAVDDLRASFSDSEIAMIMNDRAATKLRDGLPGLASVFGKAGADAKQFAGAMGRTGQASGRAAQQLVAARQAARTTARGFISLGDSLDDSKVSLHDWITQLARQADALRNFASNAIKAAHRGLDEGLIRSLKEAGPEGALRMKQLADATDAELGRANRAWREGQAAIRAYVNMEVPPKPIEVDASQAFDTIGAVRYALASLHDKTISINTVHTTSYLNKISGMPHADGGLIRGPGGPRDDVIPAWLSNKEYIMPAAAVEHYGVGMMDAIRARHFADGGSVGGAKAREKAYRSGLREFDIRGSMSTKEIRRELLDFAKVVSKTNHVLGKNFVELGKRAMTLSEEWDKAQAKVQRIREIRSTVRDTFNNDAFTGSLSNFDSQVEADTNDARKMAAALRKAGKHGLDGPLAAALAQSGNLLLAQEFKDLTRGQIRRRERQFEGRTSAQRDLGQTAVNVAGLPQAVRAMNKLTQRLNHLEDRIEGAVHKGAKEGTAQHRRQQNANAAAMTRLGR